MKYSVYFHGACFDGIASAAVLSYILKQRGDTVVKYHPTTYPIDISKEWKAMKFRHPVAIVDFLYHPKADIWFDHHPTTFIDDGWKDAFTPDDFHQISTKSPSCTGFIVNHARKRLNIRLPSRFSSFAQWLDVFDAAKFKSPKEALRWRYPAEKIRASTLEDASEAFQLYLIKQLRDRSLAEVARLPRVKRNAQLYKEKIEQSLGELKRRIVVEGRVAFIDVSDGEVIGSRFAAFYFHPQLRYIIRLVRHKKFELSVGENPWNRPKNGVHIGNFLRKRYGGGGHQYVGGASFPTKKAALEAAKEVTRHLKK